MTRNSSALPINARLLQVGAEIVPVYGNDTSGWTLESDDLHHHTRVLQRYRSLDELFFVLVNLATGSEGSA